MKKSLTKNSIFYLIYEVLNVVFPFLTGMYVARVLLADSIGQVAYAQNIAQYFVIFSFLGIPTYGMREVAKTKKNKDDLNRLYTELMIINTVSTLVFLVIYLSMVFLIQSFRSQITLFLVVGLSIALNFLNNSWLYTGLEEFPYISVRNVFFKVISFVLLVFLVKDTDDYMKYASITAIGTAGNYLMNITHARKFVSIDFKGLKFKKHLRPIFFLVVVNLAIEIYTLVDTTMLGILCDDKNVAFYSYGSKINKIFLQIVNTFTMVLVPRISAYYKEKRMNEFNNLLTKVLEIIVLLALPMIVGIQFTADFLIVEIYGEIYINSAYVLRILSLVLLISPVGYLLGSRVLLVAGREKKMVFCVSVGAIINVLANVILIPLCQEFGAAIASVISEVIVMAIYVKYGSYIFSLKKLRKSILKIVIAIIFMSVYLYICTLLPIYGWNLIILQFFGAIIVYAILLILLRESIITEMLVKIVHNFKHIA